MKSKKHYISIETMDEKQYMRWIKEGGVPTTDKKVVERIKNNPKNKLLEYLDAHS